MCYLNSNLHMQTLFIRSLHVVCVAMDATHLNVKGDGATFDMYIGYMCNTVQIIINESKVKTNIF